MTTMDDLTWTTKLACRLHDPAEKALVLMRDPAGHEGGTVRDLMSLVFADGRMPAEMERIVKRADWWASAGDRPQFPRGAGDARYASWTQVQFGKEGEIIHPTSGQRFPITSLGDLNVDLSELKARSLAHHRRLLEPFLDDPRLAALALWRFGPDIAEPGEQDRMGALWRLLPADTRVPDHTIWDHLDLTCAFGSAMAADPDNEPALLVVSLGPVQEFIAQARSTSDLWAGSHLLSCLSWEAMRVICEALGPEQIIQPQLKGIALVDAWLMEQGLPARWFGHLDWKKQSTDANPLFTAALPNRFLAMVPASRASELATEITRATRQWMLDHGRSALSALLEAAGEADVPDLYCHRQLQDQLENFPEVHWSVAPFGLIKGTRSVEDHAGLQAALSVFHSEHPPGVFGHPGWRILERAGRGEIEGVRMFQPNPGSLYPGLTDLAERTLAAAKSVREFEQHPARGYRESLAGEREWLTHDETLLDLPPGQRQDTLWTRCADRSWARKGEHLDAFGLLKRLWPSLFAAKVQQWSGRERAPDQYVVSTHTMAMARNLENLVATGQRLPVSIAEQARSSRSVALPYSLAAELHRHPEGDLIKRLPDLLDALVETGELESGPARQGAQSGLERVHAAIGDLGGGRIENYYALILMDGDNMGAWLNGTHESMPTYQESWHGKPGRHCRERFPETHDYLDSPRLPSPAWHKAVSGALNQFALKLVPAVIERAHKGKVLYAGGDDVMAMVSVDDLLSVMTWLRLVYSGVRPADFTTGPGHDASKPGWSESLMQADDNFVRWAGGRHNWLNNGFIRYNNELLPTLGYRFTASAGAVIAHKKDPLDRVIRQLRAAEGQAKQGGRNAFCIKTLKRSGGAETLTAHWFAEPPSGPAPDFGPTAMAQVLELARRLGQDELSRRAVYHSAGWLRQLPPESAFANPAAWQDMLVTSLAYQFRRQSRGGRQVGDRLADLAKAIVQAAFAERKVFERHAATKELRATTVTDVIHGILVTAEFLSRDGRAARPERSSGEEVA